MKHTFTFTGKFDNEGKPVIDVKHSPSEGSPSESRGPTKVVAAVAAGSPAAQSAEDFYRRLLEQICEDPRRTRARRLAESGLQFWDAMRAESERATMRQPQENGAGQPRPAERT